MKMKMRHGRVGRPQRVQQYGEFMENPVAPWFVNGEDENGGPGMLLRILWVNWGGRDVVWVYCLFFLLLLLESFFFPGPP